MRFQLDVNGNSDGDWEVRIRTDHSADGFPVRTLRRLKTGVHEFPQITAAEAQQFLAAGVALPALCLKDEASPLIDVYGRIAARQLQGTDADDFGAYLFHTLLGREAWKQILGLAQNSRIELEFCWDADERALTRLPWEMMRAEGAGYLTGLPDAAVAFSRVVRDSGGEGERLIRLRPRVLFVIGADVEKHGEIQAGAEFIGLLRRLKAHDLVFDCRVVLHASGDRIQKEIARFKPSIVHFICHGWVDPEEGGYLDLFASDTGDEAESFFAKGLRDILRDADGNLPPVLVLNACYSATPPGGRGPATQIAAPLAAQMVQLGIPLVLAMSGRMADDACRLFTRCFYEALLRGSEVSVAAAFGRRAGLAKGIPGKSVDWALPALFLGRDVAPIVQIECVDQVIRRERVAQKFLVQNNPPAFCDRLRIVEDAYQEVVNGGTGARRVLALGVPDQDQDTNPRFGKSRVLEELAARAARQGHLPCLVQFRGSRRPPKAALALARAIIQAARQTWGWFRLPVSPQTQTGIADLPEMQTEFLIRRLGDPHAAVAFDPTIQTLLQSLRGEALVEHGTTPDEAAILQDHRVAAQALSLDLSAIAQLFRALDFAAEEPRVVVLIDDLHRMDAAVLDVLLHDLLQTEGLTPAFGQPVPVIFAYSGNQTIQENADSIAKLIRFLEVNPNFVRSEPLSRFPTTVEQQLAYHQFLLAYEPSLVVGNAEDQLGPGQLNEFFSELHGIVEGVPSKLKTPNTDLETFLRTLLKFSPVLRQASDADVVRAIWEQ